MLVRLPDRTVHLDPRVGFVQIRAPRGDHPLTGSVVAAHAFAEVKRLRMLAREGAVDLELELESGARIPLGRAPSSDVAMLTGRAIADLCRCNLDAGQGVSNVLGPSTAFTEAATFDAPPGAGVPPGVVTLSGPAPEPDNAERITDERPSAPPRTDSLHRQTRELTKAQVQAACAEPVFGALLRESELASALDPAALADDLMPRASTPEPPPVMPSELDAPEDQKPTLVGLQSLSARPETVAKMLSLAAERLPVAEPRPPSPPRRPRSRVRSGR